eukprot:scaffold44312_cov37-Tisochrysis_lutea.AAC.4
MMVRLGMFPDVHVAQRAFGLAFKSFWLAYACSARIFFPLRSFPDERAFITISYRGFCRIWGVGSCVTCHSPAARVACGACRLRAPWRPPREPREGQRGAFQGAGEAAAVGCAPAPPASLLPAPPVSGAVLASRSLCGFNLTEH